MVKPGGKIVLTMSTWPGFNKIPFNVQPQLLGIIKTIGYKLSIVTTLAAGTREWSFMHAALPQREICIDIPLNISARESFKYYFRRQK